MSQIITPTTPTTTSSSPSSVTSSSSSFASMEYWVMEGFWRKHGDPRFNEGYFFMRSFRLPLAILVAYVAFVGVIGPRLMRHRKPFALKRTLLYYNVAMSTFNAYVFIRLIINYAETFPRMLNTTFPPLDERTDWDMEIITFNYLYMVSKFVDLFDTVFFVLRKKQNQITLLHCYHHFTVAVYGWVTLRLCAMLNIAAPFVFMNSFIHVLMYSYYALAAQGPAMAPFLWWKRYLTQLQIAQFIVLFLHSVFFVLTQTGYSMYYTYNYGVNTVVYLILFTRFYMQTYDDKKKMLLQHQQQRNGLKKMLETEDVALKKENGLKCE